MRVVSVTSSSSASHMQQEQPRSDGDRLLDRDEAASRRKPKRMPNMLQALQLLPTASWLQVRNGDVHDLKNQVTSEVTNLGKWYRRGGRLVRKGKGGKEGGREEQG